MTDFFYTPLGALVLVSIWTLIAFCRIWAIRSDDFLEMKAVDGVYKSVIALVGFVIPVICTLQWYAGNPPKGYENIMAMCVFYGIFMIASWLFATLYSRRRYRIVTGKRL